jgi:hypothetical protein
LRRVARIIPAGPASSKSSYSLLVCQSYFLRFGSKRSTSVLQEIVISGVSRVFLLL